MEEENGKLRLALNILILGLKVCKISESIVTRVIKLQERLHKYESVREMLSLLKNESIDKVWKSILEGSLFEARAGNIAISRKLLNYLMKHVPWYGPIYLEAFRLEERENNFNAALSIIRKGLKELPRYGPLWFGLMRLIEMSDSAVEKSSWVTGKRPALAILHKEVKEALKSISKELTWKVHYELSQAEERAADIAAFGMHTATGKCLKECKDEFLVGARLSLVNALLVCPGNLRWKIFLAGARMELSVGKVETARELLRRAFAEVPIKSKATVYLECARVEEFVGNLTFARQILLKARIEIKSEWKLFLEAVMLEARNNNLLESLQLAKSSVKLHPGTGRLWAMYIQLCHRVEFTALWSIELGGLRDSTESQMSDKHGDDGKDFPGKSSTGSYVYSRKERVIAAAIAAVPKSGEVWCERSRCYLNPFNVSSFDLLEAQRSLSFAIQFTPQYGDSFLELIRIELLCQVLLPVVFQALKMPFVPFLKGHLIGDEEADLADFVDNNRAHEILNSRFQPMPVPAPAHERQVRRQRIAAIENMEYRFGNLVPLYKKIMISNLHRR